MVMSVPDEFARRIIGMRASSGAAWLDRLPALVAGAADRWSLTVGPPFADLSYNYAAPAERADGTRAVLKIGFPDQELLTEAEALRRYGGHGAVRLLEADLAQGVLLLERLEPGTPLLSVEDDENATAIAANVLRRLWRSVPADHPFPTVADWGAGFARMRDRFGGTTGPLPPALTDAAERQFAELLSSMAEPVLLHGDLHHANVLAAARDPWLAIDPKGIVGEPAYDTGAWLRNWLPDLLELPRPDRILARRIDQFTEALDLDRERVRAWGMAQAVLSAWWMIEDHGAGWEPAIEIARLLAQRKA